MKCFARFDTICTIKNLKNTHRGVLVLASFTNSSTRPWVFFTFLKLHKWYQMAQCITYSSRVFSRRFKMPQNCSKGFLEQIIIHHNYDYYIKPNPWYHYDNNSYIIKILVGERIADYYYCNCYLIFLINSLCCIFNS